MPRHSPPSAPGTDSTDLIGQIDSLLPQTQCTKCGYPDCRAYATAIASGAASYNQCPPGGAEGVSRLAALLGKPVIPINPLNGAERVRPVAVIDESLCIGCTLCIQACPVDAIVGAGKQMHTVIDDLCTGCDLCVAPCPVDCIAMVDCTPGRTGWDAWSPRQADQARARYRSREARLIREKQENDARLAAKAAAKLREVENMQSASPEEQRERERKRAVIQAALERNRIRQQQEQ